MKDKFIERLVSFLTRSVYRDVEVFVSSGLPTETPMLAVSNHFGGFADALVLLDVMPRRPGIVARDVIWRTPLVGRLMNWIGAIPVHKAEDRGSTSSNDEMFKSCYQALAEGGNLLIFPEGVTRNEPSIAPVKTGAARIALGARAHGVAGLNVVPVGIHYEDKAALRSRVFVNVGSPIDVDAAIAADSNDAHDVDANDRDAVRSLTEQIATALRQAAPDYDSWSEAQLLTAGSEITLRSLENDLAMDVDLALRDRLANTLADRPAECRESICEAVSIYHDDLDALGYSDAELHSRLGAGTFVRSIVWQIIFGVFLLPFALVGAVVNIIPFLVVKAVGALRFAPSMLSTLKPLAAFGAFGAVWGIVIWMCVRSFGWEAGVAAFVLLPVYLAAVIVLVERCALMWGLVRRRRATESVRQLPTQVAERRAAVIESVLAA